MKKLIIILGILLVGCSSKLQKEYDKASKEEDLREIKHLVSEDEFKYLTNYITECEAKDVNLEGLVYNIILIDAKQNHYDNEQKIKQQQEEAEKRKKIEEKTKLLCGKKWRYEKFAYQMKIPYETEKNIELAKQGLQMSLKMLDGLNLSFSVEKNRKGIFVKGYDEGIQEIFTREGKRFKEYFSDGTFVEYHDKDTVKGKWNFYNENSISEGITREQGFLNKQTKKGYILDILNLDNENFSFQEQEYQGYNKESSNNIFIVLKKDK